MHGCEGPERRGSGSARRVWGFLVGGWLAGGLLAGPPVITNAPASQTVFLGDPVTFGVGASGTGPLSYQWLRNGAAVAGATTATWVFPAVAADHNVQFAVRVTNVFGAITSAPAVLTVDFGMAGPERTTRWVDTTSVWRYQVTQALTGAAWTAPGYGDGGWPSGGGVLFVEDAALPAPKTTPLPLVAGSLPRTCYFRTRFTNDLAGAYALRLVVNTLVDDGVVCHLNGAPAFWLGMTEGAADYNAFANRTVSDAAWEGPFDFPATNLVAGVNLLAAEVHQVNATSSDIVLGLTLDAVWQPRLRDTAAPVVVETVPASGSTVASLTRIQVRFNEPVQGVDVADLRVNGVTATRLTVLAPDNYVFAFPAAAAGAASATWAPGHGITDRSANSNAFGGAGFGFLVGSVSSAVRLGFATVRQSSDASAATVAGRAVDGSTATSSLTADAVGSYWQAEWGRPFPLERIEVVNRPAPDDAGMSGLVVRLSNMDDQVVYQTSLSNPGPGGVALLSLPPGVQARTLWIGLPGTQTNGAGNRRVGLAEVRAFGTPGLPYGPGPVVPATNAFRVWQSSEYGGGAFPAANAVDGDTGNFTHTDNVPDSYWMADLGRMVPLDRIEVVNRSSCCDLRLAGVVLRVFDGASNSVAATTLTNPGLGGTWTYVPGGAVGARWLRLGLENGRTNGHGNHYVSLAEVRAYSGATNVLGAGANSPVPVTNNLASFKPSCMLRLTAGQAPASNANDNTYATEVRTTQQTVDGYWEVDLGATHALYGVRAIAAGGIGWRLTNAIVRLYDGAHESGFARKLIGTPDAFDLDLDGPVFARYVRVGLEDKQRTDPAGGIEFYIGFREIEVFGRPTNGIGVVSFQVSTNRVAPGERVALTWAVDDVRRVELHPGIGSVGAWTGADGIGRLEVAVTNATEFVLVASNAAGLFFGAAGVQTGALPLAVRLSEVVADNQYSLADGYGEAPDWIELRNPGDAAVPLAGWGLSDDPARPMKWTFPTVTLAPHAALVVFASGRETPVDPGGNLHASFRLDKNGGALVLTAADGVTTVDRLAAYPELDTDLAYGRDLEGNWAFLEPTPRAPNAANGYLGWLKTPDWSHARGFYDSGFTLTLTNRSPGAALVYSLGGALPSRPYTNGLAIAGTTAVRAQAVRPGYKPSRVQTRTFLFVNDVITSPVMNTAVTQNPAYAPRMRPGLLALPTVSLCLPGQPEYEEREGSLEILWPDGRDPVQINCGLLRFGNAWTKFEKRSFRMKCRARYGAARLHAPLFDGFDRGVVAQSSFDELDFRSGSQDMVERGFYMAARFVEDALLDMGSLNPHGRYVHLYLNGVYWGQFDCRELLVEPFLADYLGGSKDDYVVVRGNDNVGDEFVVGAPEPPNIQPWERVLSLGGSFVSVRSYLDVPHLIDFMLLWNYGNCESEFRACGPIAAGTGFKFWIADADGFLRTSAMGLDRTSRAGPGGLFGSLVREGHADFKTLLADRIYRHCYNGGALTPAALDARLATRMQEVRDSLLAECARWNYRTPANWESAAATVRSGLFPGRTAQLAGYLRGAGLYPTFDPPAFNLYGGLVTNGFRPTLSSAAGTIYYTLDETDPRLPGGAVAPGARVWTAGAVTIGADTALTARVRTAGGQWSALAQPRFLLAVRRAPGARDLLFTEIQFNPDGSDAYEFVELCNVSTNLLDLSGVSVSNAVHFVFPSGFALAPGAFAVVVEDRAAFAARYQDPASVYYWPELRVAGAWSGGLGNAGETLSLVASNGVVLASIAYQVGGAWPERSDGGGSSIELTALPPAAATDAEVQAFVAAGGNWRASSLYHGSPGRLGGWAKAVRISEVLPAGEVGGGWIELVNTGTEPADLAGWSLTDDSGRPDRWVFPDGAALGSGGYKVLTAAELGFGFSRLGGRALLLETRGTNVLRFLDTVDFPAASPGETFGTYGRSDGETDFTELRVPTPGAANALPRVGPVVLSEIRYNPAPGKAAFVALANITAATVPLFDLAHPTNVWVLEGVGRFLFPAGTAIPGCSTLIVCATNPAAFRAQYGLGLDTSVLGPWPGALSTEGEALKLWRPGTPEPGGSVPMERVDHVSYRTHAPWPAVAAATSLLRLPPEAYGNDAAAWRAGPANGTPGAAAGNRPLVLLADGPLALDEESAATWVVSVADPDAPWQSPVLQATRLPPGSVFDATTGILTWTPAEAQGPGTYVAGFAAWDRAGCGERTGTLVLELAVREANQRPRWSPQPDVTWPAGMPTSIPLAVADPDRPAQPLSFVAEGLPPGFHFDAGGVRLAGTGEVPGDYPVRITVSDGQAPPLDAALELVLHVTERFALTAEVGPAEVGLSVPVLAGERYRVERCDDLGVAAWSLLGEIAASATGTFRITDPGAGGGLQRFYRVQWLR